MAKAEKTTFRKRLHRIIFGTDTPAGKGFDIGLIIAIILSIAVVMLESVDSFQARFSTELYYIEWGFTILFTIEYLARIYALKKPLNYILSFYGIVDLLSILPTYLGIFGPSLGTIRILRLMRIFRILKLIGFLREANDLKKSLRASLPKIMVFLLAILGLVTILGSVMYIIETREAGFTSIPRSIYWAIVTLTTVGYGDIAPKTELGQFVASIIMILGYAIIAVPTGIVTSEMSRNKKNTEIEKVNQACDNCNATDHKADASFCRMCGNSL